MSLTLDRWVSNPFYHLLINIDYAIIIKPTFEKRNKWMEENIICLTNFDLFIAKHFNVDEASNHHCISYIN